MPPRAAMIAPPRLPTVSWNSPRSHSACPIFSGTGLPLIFARWNALNIVGLWLPKMKTSLTAVSGTPAFFASCVCRAVLDPGAPSR